MGEPLLMLLLTFFGISIYQTTSYKQTDNKKTTLVVISITERNCEKTGTSKELWDRLCRQMDIAATNMSIFRHFFFSG